VNTVGVIANPIAGKDIRRLVSAASHTSDSSKIDIIRRAVIAACECGAERVLLAPDPHHLARRAIDGLDVPAEVLDVAVDGHRHDTVAAAEAMWKRGVGVVIALGGDGTCRDVARGWPDVTMIAISTGTNNVYPTTIDATSAGSAAAFIATTAMAVAPLVRRSKRLLVTIEDDDRHEVIDDLALVDVALIDTTFVGSRAVLDPRTVRAVVAAIAHPASTGLSSIAGRVHPVDRWEPGGVSVRLGDGGRGVRVPMSPGAFATLDIVSVEAVADGDSVVLRGPGVLAFDGERDHRLHATSSARVRVDAGGPLLVDVPATLLAAAANGLFDARRTVASHLEDDHAH